MKNHKISKRFYRLWKLEGYFDFIFTVFLCFTTVAFYRKVLEICMFVGFLKYLLSLSLSDGKENTLGEYFGREGFIKAN